MTVKELRDKLISIEDGSKEVFLYNPSEDSYFDIEVVKECYDMVEIYM